MNQWTVPVVLGLVAAGLTWAFAPDEIHLPQPTDADVRTQSPYVLAPLAGTAPYDAALLRYNATDTRHGLGGILDVHVGLVDNGTLWKRGGWECVRDPPCEGPVEAIDLQAHVESGATAGATDATASGAATEPGAARDGPAADAPSAQAPNASAGPRMGPEYPTARITFYMFTGSGHLLSTNAPRSHWMDYDLHRDFTAFSQTWWHLGTGPAPPGAGKVPLREEAYVVLNGTPVGGVQSAVLEQHKYDWLVGTVWLTARVEDLSAAQPGPRAG